MCSPPKVKSPSITTYPPFTLSYLSLSPPSGHEAFLYFRHSFGRLTLNHSKYIKMHSHLTLHIFLVGEYLKLFLITLSLLRINYFVLMSYFLHFSHIFGTLWKAHSDYHTQWVKWSWSYNECSYF